MISNIRKNIMGTVSFAGKFDGMRKAQDFIVTHSMSIIRRSPRWFSPILASAGSTCRLAR